jgi:Fe-S-cluster containining protein
MAWKFMNEDLSSQRFRLQAIYYRRVGDNVQAEKALLAYREKFKPDLKAKVKINKIDLSQKYPKDKILDNMDNIYQEVSAIQKEVLARSGVHEDTCFYYGCSDCCKKDFPTVSLVEFLHIKNWIEKNKIDIKPFIARTQAIQEKHTQLFGEPLKIVDQAKSLAAEENPYALQFVCPFLDDKDRCQVHEARPLACRSFGLATIDGASVQACKYYLTQHQYNSSTHNERDVFDSEPATHMLGEANNYLAGQHGYGDMQQPVGTLVAWLMGDHT